MNSSESDEEYFGFLVMYMSYGTRPIRQNAEVKPKNTEKCRTLFLDFDDEYLLIINPDSTQVDRILANATQLIIFINILY